MRIDSVIGPDKRKPRYAASTALALVVVLLIGCTGGRDQSGEFYTHWDIAGGCTSGIVGDDWVDAGGRRVDVCNSAGRADWVWVTYAAGWCGASRTQAAQVRGFTATARPRMEVFTVLTSGNEVFSPANSGHAGAWASAHGLPADRVLAQGGEPGGRVIPQHLLIGPDKQTWYRYIGHLDSEAMHALVDDFSRGRRTPNVRELPRR